MSSINFSIPTDLAIGGNLTVNGSGVISSALSLSGISIAPTGTNRLRVGGDFTLNSVDSGNLFAQIMSAAGVLSINTATGIVTIATAGTNVFVSNSGTTIYISGSGIAQSFDLTATGAFLFARDSSISGGLQSQIAQSGQQAWSAANSNATTISGNVTQTGVQLAATAAATYATIANLALTGQQAWTADNNNAVAISGNVTQTGVQLGAQLASLSGLAVQSGNARSYTGAVGVGVNFLAVTFSPPFPGIPAVVASVQVTGSVMYLANISGVTANGYNALFSATTTENLILNTNAFYRA